MKWGEYMISDVYTERHEIAFILSEIERIGKFCGLQPSHAGKLRLLAEEMLSLTVRLFSEVNYEFFVESKDKAFTLNLKADTLVSEVQKERLLSMSSSGKNKESRGIFGKISAVFESLLLNDGAFDQIVAPFYDSMGLMPYFSLSVYQDEMSRTAGQEQWDELEKSIIASLAKEVIIGARNNKAEMIVTTVF